jgi:hypothetical protein
MGIDNSCIRLLMREGNRKKFSGRILQLGKQTVATTGHRIEEIAREEKFELSEPLCDMGYREIEGRGAVSDEYLFRRLGFDMVDSLDKNTFEGANVVWDLNQLLQKEFANIGAYNFIYDGGTMEHLFHVPNALNNIFKLLSVDGRVAHLSPVKFINHGFYNFSTFFYEEFYETNKFLIEECGIIKLLDTKWKDHALYATCDKNSQFVRSLNPTLLDGATFIMNFIATKLPESTGDRIPQQGIYNNAWDLPNAVEEYGNSGLVHGSSPLKSIYAKLTAVPILKHLIKKLRNSYANYLVKWGII